VAKQGVGGQVGAMVLDAPWRQINTLCNLSKTDFKTETLTKNVFKTLYLKKAVKITSALGASPSTSVGNSRLWVLSTDPHVVRTPTITNFLSASF